LDGALPTLAGILIGAITVAAAAGTPASADQAASPPDRAAAERPLVMHWPAQVDPGAWSHGRLIADPPIVAAVASRERLPDGSVVGPARQEAYVGATDEDRVSDFTYAPARSYVTACGFWVRDPVIYWEDLWVPLTVRRR